MDTKELFSKLNSKDYNYQLERILENKDFSESVKNLLLSMLYKVEMAYKDYITVKKVVENKKTYIEEILRIIKEKCNKIVIVKEGSKEAEELEKAGSKFLVDKLEGIIYLMYPNETLMLYTLYKLDDKQIYVDEKYNLIRNALSELLNAGENINNIEALRDFNGWNWNSLGNEIPEIATNLIYQNLIYLLGISFIKDLIHKEEVVDYVKLIKENLSLNYGEVFTNDMLNLIYKISIIICTQKNEVEKKRLLDEREVLQSEYKRLQDKKGLLNEISAIKKEALKRIKEIDNILNDKKLLEEEYIKRNEKRTMYNKIFSISHLVEILSKERKKQLGVIEENNHLLEPKYYVEKVKELEKQLDLLKNIADDVETLKQEENKIKYLIELQKIFIQCLYKKVENSKEKEEIINLFYMVRYYNLLFITPKTQIKDMEELKEDLKNLEEFLIEKSYELKAINIITNEETTNNEIIINILKTKIISLENIEIELKQNSENLEINIYDGDVFEKTIVIPVFDKKKVVMKFNKAQKIFS